MYIYIKFLYKINTKFLLKKDGLKTHSKEREKERKKRYKQIMHISS